MKPSGARAAGARPRAFVAVVLSGLVGLSALSSASCAAPLMKLPAGAGAPAPDAADALAQATATCRGIRTLTAEIALSGSAGGRRVRGRLSAGVAAPASVRLEAAAPFGPPVFIFVATNDDATLLLPRDDRVLEHGRPGAVLDAVAGVPLDAADLQTTLTGCAPPVAQAAGRAFGADWRVVTASVGSVQIRAVPPARPGCATMAPGFDASYRLHRFGVARGLSRFSKRPAAIDSRGDRRHEPSPGKRR